MADLRIRKSERKVYTVVWILVAALYVLNLVRIRVGKGFPALDWKLLTVTVSTLAPFFILFIINNILITKLLLRNKTAGYFFAVSALVVAFFICQDMAFQHHRGTPGDHLVLGRHPMPPPPEDRDKAYLFPMPLLLEYAYGLVVVGSNLAVALMFQHFADRIENERFMKISAENQLAYLRGQINPHFYMNMLNNIHGMIEIDPAKAQTMVLDMSHLMRYMLYESSLRWIPLADEVGFLDNYMRLMRIRYPEGRVRLSLRKPGEAGMNGVRIPPILFLVFVENAFKHGISYQDPSYVDVGIKVLDEAVEFRCVNSVHEGKSSNSGRTLTERHPHWNAEGTSRPEDIPDSGIGLANVRRRLELIYGGSATLDIKVSGSSYTVNLIIPKHNAKNTDNR